MKKTKTLIALWLFTLPAVFAQSSQIQYNVLIDVSHHQKFWNDPKDMVENTGADIERVKYLTNQMAETVKAVKASFGYIKSQISSETLKSCDLLFIHVPTSQYDKKEIKAISSFVENGGALFLVMEVDYWSTLNQTNVNDIVRPFNIGFKGQIPDSLSGGFTTINPITQHPLKVIYHGGRIVEGGNPFCFNNEPEKHPFGVYDFINQKGKVVIMGDGMVSLYMTSWNGVDNYASQSFMQSVFKWLLDK